MSEPNRIISLMELASLDGDPRIEHTQLLPGEMCIVNPTEHERRLLDIYAVEIARLSPGEGAVAE